MDYYINLPEDFDTETFLDTLHLSGIYDFKAILGTFTTKNLTTQFNYKFVDLDIEKYMSIISRVARDEELPLIIFSTGNFEDSENISINIHFNTTSCDFTLNIDSPNVEDGNIKYIYSLLKDNINRIMNGVEYLDYITIVDPTAIVLDGSGICSSRGSLSK
jgi:hypothetical protein